METLQKSHVVIHVSEDHHSDTHHQSDDEEQRRSSGSSSNSDNDEDDDDEIVKARRGSSVSSEVDLECCEESKVVQHLGKIERDCRICHLSLLDSGGNQESGGGGVPIELGCSCKADLAAAHKHCAEAWFKIKGNKTCEICGSVARNVAGANEPEVVERQWNETNEAAVAIAASSIHPPEGRRFWQGHRFLNFLLACMVFAFVISWLFHFNVRS